MSEGQCNDHSGHAQLLNQLERVTADLYLKHETMQKSLTDTIIATGNQYIDLRFSQKETTSAIERLEKLVKDHIEHDENKTSEYQQKIEALCLRIDEYDDFGWFIRPMNRIRDRFMLILIVAICALSSAFFLYEAHIVQLIKAWG